MIQIHKNILNNLIQCVLPLTTSKTTLSITQNIKFEFVTGKLTVTTTDLDNYISLSANCQCADEGSFCVNGRKIAEIVKELHNGYVYLSLTNNTLLITSEQFECKLQTISCEDFPVANSQPAGLEITIPGQQLQSLISVAGDCNSNEETRGTLCGIIMRLMPFKIVVASTDGSRLAQCTIMQNNGCINAETSFILNRKTIDILQKNISEKDVLLEISERDICFSFDGFVLESKLMQGFYPKYENVIPKDNDKIIIVNRSLLLSAVRRVSVLSNSKTHFLKCFISNNKIELSVFNREHGGEAKQIIPTEYEGEELTIGLNSVNFINFLNKCDCQNVTMEFKTPTSAVLIIPENSTNRDDLFLLMPLRMNDEE